MTLSFVWLGSSHAEVETRNGFRPYRLIWGQCQLTAMDMDYLKRTHLTPEYANSLPSTILARSANLDPKNGEDLARALLKEKNRLAYASLGFGGSLLGFVVLDSFADSIEVSLLSIHPLANKSFVTRALLDLVKGRTSRSNVIINIPESSSLRIDLDSQGFEYEAFVAGYYGESQHAERWVWNLPPDHTAVKDSLPLPDDKGFEDLLRKLFSDPS